MPVIGLLNGQPTALGTSLLAAFRRGVAEMGFVESRNLAIVYRSADGNIERLREQAIELTRVPVAAIAAVGGDNAVRATMAATKTIPIVFTTGGDPVATGFVASINRPGGNVTGVSLFAAAPGVKRLELLRELMPDAARVGVLADPSKRTELGAAGARKMHDQFSWHRAATVRLQDFRAAMEVHSAAGGL
jgi:putative ABC transport system substrate-binding protein